MLNGLILKNGQILIVANSPFKQRLLHYVHNDLQFGHSSFLNTYHRAKKDFYWVGMKRYIIRQVTRECEICQAKKMRLSWPLDFYNIWLDLSKFVQRSKWTSLKVFFCVVVTLLSWLWWIDLQSMATLYILTILFLYNKWLKYMYLRCLSYMNFPKILQLIGIPCFWVLYGSHYLHCKDLH